MVVAISPPVSFTLYAWYSVPLERDENGGELLWLLWSFCSYYSNDPSQLCRRGSEDQLSEWLESSPSCEVRPRQSVDGKDNVYQDTFYMASRSLRWCNSYAAQLFGYSCLSIGFRWRAAIAASFLFVSNNEQSSQTSSGHNARMIRVTTKVCWWCSGNLEFTMAMSSISPNQG